MFSKKDLDKIFEQKIFTKAEGHRGTSLIEILQNCVIFNDKAFGSITAKEVKQNVQLFLEDGSPMLFGAKMNKGIVLNGFKLAVVTIGENGVSEEDILVHDAKEKDPTLHTMLARMQPPEFPVALGVIRATKESGKSVKVIATETRPIQQGSRLTAFELKHDGFDVSLIPDTAVGYTMANGLVNKVVVGADRIVKTGHVFNKIGTYQVATMAKQHGIPFYVAAPLSTIDLETKSEDVIIEMRKSSEVTGIGDKKTAPDDINVINPAFDMTPPELITGIITEKGVAHFPFEDSIPKLFEKS